MQVYESTGILASSGLKVAHNNSKVTYIFDAADGTYIVAQHSDRSSHVQLRSIQVGMDLASQKRLSPEPLPFPHGSRLSGYRYVFGHDLTRCETLNEIYREIGSFSAKLHSLDSSTIMEARDLVDTFRSVDLPDWISQSVEGVTREANRVFLHGDLNASNLIRTAEGIVAIDFDECGCGPPELDLAIALGYVNTDECDWLTCFSTLANSYIEGGGKLDFRRLAVLSTLAPFYMLATSIRSSQQRVDVGILLETAAAQHQKIVSAISSLSGSSPPV